MKNIFFFLALLLSSCATGKLSDETINIEVSQFAGEKTNTINSVGIIDTLQLLISDNVISFHTKDACMNDSVIYILDDQGNIMSFDISSGVNKKAINQKGHGHAEYLNAKSICYSNDRLYVLDCQANAIIEYDKNLCYKRKIKYDFSALDFAKTQDGFVLFNITPNDKVKEIVFIDENGKIQNSCETDSPTFKNDATDKVFVRSDKGTYIVNPTSNTLYKVEDNDITPFANISSTHGTSDKLTMMNSFVLQD